MRELGWDRFVTPEAATAGLEAAVGKADGARHQLVAYAGWLTFNNDYQAELEALRARWRSQSVKPPCWPLLAPVSNRQPIPVPAGTIDPALLRPEDTAACLDQATAFMRKWSLAGLATWDLPLPQGPLEQVPLGLATSILGPEHIGTFIPPYYDTPSRQDLREELREQQRGSGRSAGIDSDFPLTNLSARADKASELESAFRLWFIETAARQRYAGRPRLSACLVAAFMQKLGCSEDRVKQLRRIYKFLL
jgi:hypothetical protein